MNDQQRRRPGFHPAARVGSGMGYVGDGNYSSGDYGSDAPNDYDYDYAGFKGDAGIDEYGDNEYGGGRYGQGPFEQSQQYGANGFSSGRGPFGALQRQYENRVDPGDRQDNRHRVYEPLSYDDEPQRNRGYSGYSGAQDEGFARSELGGTADWRSAPDIADPSSYRIFQGPDERHHRPAARSAARGPKGYRRSDERILEDIYEHLLPARHLDTSDVRIDVADGVATLSGSVPDRRMKHFIEDLVHGIRHVKDVENRIRVKRLQDE